VGSAVRGGSGDADVVAEATGSVGALFSGGEGAEETTGAGGGSAGSKDATDDAGCGPDEGARWSQ